MNKDESKGKINNQITVRLFNMTFFAKQGVTKEERTIGNRYEVDTELILIINKKDRIQSTVNYAKIYHEVERIMMHQSFHLIESIAMTIAEKCLALSPRVLSALVKVRKRNPPIGNICDYAEAEYLISKQNTQPKSKK